MRRPLHPSIVKVRVSSCLRERTMTNEELKHYHVIKNLFRLMIHDVSNLFINFEIFMSSIEKNVEESVRKRKENQKGSGDTHRYPWSLKKYQNS